MFRKNVFLLAVLHTGLMLHILLDFEDGHDIPPKRRLPFSGLHGVLSQKTGPFKLPYTVLETGNMRVD
jgi:hypothetical protein